MPLVTIAAGMSIVAATVLTPQWSFFPSAVAVTCFGLMAYIWGYSVRALRSMLWPSLDHFHRRQYAEVWDSLAASRHAAASAVSGKQDEPRLKQSAAEPVRNLLDLAAVTKHDDVLEIGCGIGRIGVELAPHCRSWTGADVSANMLAYAGIRLAGVKNAHLQKLHGVGLGELGEYRFDLVYITGVFPHLDEMDRWQYVNDSFRVLRPGGRIYIDGLDLESDRGWDAFVNDVRRFRDLERPPYIPRFSTAAELTTYLTRAGFQQVCCNSRPPLTIVTGVKPAASVQRSHPLYRPPLGPGSSCSDS